MNAEIIKKEFASYRVHFFDQADNEPSESNIYRLSDGPDFLIVLDYLRQLHGGE
jgi:hypothetical protein